MRTITQKFQTSHVNTWHMLVPSIFAPFPLELNVWTIQICLGKYAVPVLKVFAPTVAPHWYSLLSKNVAFMVSQDAAIKYVNNLVELVTALQHIHVSYVVSFSPGAFFFSYLSPRMRHLVCWWATVLHRRHFYIQNGAEALWTLHLTRLQIVDAWSWAL